VFIGWRYRSTLQSSNVQARKRQHGVQKPLVTQSL
jgi:hypothetical protein